MGKGMSEAEKGRLYLELMMGAVKALEDGKDTFHMIGNSKTRVTISMVTENKEEDSSTVVISDIGWDTAAYLSMALLYHAQNIAGADLLGDYLGDLFARHPEFLADYITTSIEGIEEIKKHIELETTTGE